MKNIAILTASFLALTACASQVPNSGAGVGFSDYAQYELERAQREAALQGTAPRAPTLSQNGAIIPPTNRSAAIVPPAVQPTQGISSSELSAAGINTVAPTPIPTVTPTVTPAVTPPITANVTPVESQVPFGSNPEISDEQNFNAVSSRESIESDAQRRARQAAAYQLIEVSDLPSRSGDTGPNIVQYALQAPNNRGESVFSRSGLSSENRFQRNCAKYRTPDDAQRDFLTRGGPSRDRLGIDPDGDGFACGWDPQAFRSVAGN